jgi:hypothetical protein
MTADECVDRPLAVEQRGCLKIYPQALVGVLVTVMQKVPLSKPLKYHDKSHKKSVTP